MSAKGRFIPGNFDEFLQTDASINPGNSGGPLISIHGEVVGVNSAIYTRTGSNMGIGFAIPVNIVKEELNQLRASGKVVRGWLGVYIQKMTPEIAESLGLHDADWRAGGRGPEGRPCEVRRHRAWRRDHLIRRHADHRFARASAAGRAHAYRARRDPEVDRVKASRRS